MDYAETLKLAMTQIMAHKLRSFLTLLGMIIGMTAFMLVLSLLESGRALRDWARTRGIAELGLSEPSSENGAVQTVIPRALA